LEDKLTTPTGLLQHPTMSRPTFLEKDIITQKPSDGSVYFHGNAEDVGHSYEFFVKLSVTFKCSVLAVEYPGYGIYSTESADAETISLNAELVV
jgi:hypothetical protein